MNTGSAHRISLYWAGFALGPAAWAINTQTIYAMAPHACPGANPAAIILALVLTIIAVSGTFLSLRAIRLSAAAEWTDAQGGRAQNFMAWVGVGSGVLFALVILNQLAAALMVSPCLR